MKTEDEYQQKWSMTGRFA